MERIKISRNWKVKKEVTHPLLESQLESHLGFGSEYEIMFEGKGRKEWVKFQKSICILSVKSKSEISSESKEVGLTFYEVREESKKKDMSRVRNRRGTQTRCVTEQTQTRTKKTEYDDE